MDATSEFVVFADESGDHGLQTIDRAYPVFVLAFCLFRQRDYAHQLLPRLTEFKFRHFGHDQVILHERDIRKDQGDFAIFRDRERKAEFLGELTDLIDGLQMTVIATAIRKDRLVGRYSAPISPYEIALAFGLERIDMWLKRQGAVGKTTVIVEKRGHREDNDLELEFRRICDGGNFHGIELSCSPRFVAKSANVPGLQVADLIARPIGRHVLFPLQQNRAYDVIEKKLDKSPKEVVKGWGLKVFPE